MPRVVPLIRLAGSLLAAAVALPAAVGDPQIATDHPQMQGELSCSTFARVEASAFANFQARYGHAPATATEKVIAHWAWRTEHHQHADGNNVLYGNGCDPAVGSGSEGSGFCRDGLVGLFGFSTGLCYSIHSQLTPFIQRSLNNYYTASCTLVEGHTAFEAYSDGAWRLADVTVGNMVFNKSASTSPVSILDIGAVPDANKAATFDGGFMNLALVPFGDNLSVYNTIKAGEEAGAGRQKMMGFLGMPIVYSLRTGESFTRWRQPDGDDGVEAIWSTDYFDEVVPYPKRHGMARRETFLTYGAVGNGNIGRKAVANRPFVYSAKGAFAYAPALTAAELTEWNASPTLAASGGKITASGGSGTFVLTHAAPYPIAAHQADNAAAIWNVFANACDQTAVLSLSGTAGVAVALSVDAGQTWANLTWTGAPLDFSNLVKGRYSYQLRVTVPNAGQVSAVGLRTVVQVGPAVFPWLKDGGSTISYQASNLGVIHGGPDHRMAAAFRDPSHDSTGWKAYKITAPGNIRSLHGVSLMTGRYVEISVETSLDGTNWDVAMAPVTMQSGSATGLDNTVWGNGFMWGDRSYPTGTSKTGYIRFKNSKETGTQVYATYELPGTGGSLDAAVNWTDGSGTHNATRTFTAGTGTQSWTVATGANTVTNWIRFSVPTSTNAAPTVSAGPNQSITLPAGASLDGTVTDDGLPSGTLTYAWTRTSGPGTVTFADAAAVDTTATFSVAGTYVLRLTASDGALGASDEVQVTVGAANVAPTVDAGLDQSIALPGGATLDATVTDDGLPGGAVTCAWTKVSGPGTVTFANAALVDTTATFSVDGVYILRLTANDGALSASDTVQITVTPVGVNGPPSVSAGADQAILPPASASLDGTVLDDGLPSGTVTCTWSAVSGPGTVTFANAALADTTAAFSVDGVYVLRLTANDGALSASDTVQITVGTPPPGGGSVAITGSAGGSAGCGAGGLLGLVLVWLPLAWRRRR